MFHKIAFIVALLALLTTRSSPHIVLAFVAGYFGLVALSFIQHRVILQRSLRTLDLTLKRFRYSSGFISWDTDPVWWQWRTVYSALAADQAGKVIEYSFWVSGPFFALFAHQHGFNVYGEVRDGD